jgi:hypothetical protein
MRGQGSGHGSTKSFVMPGLIAVGSGACGPVASDGLEGAGDFRDADVIEQADRDIRKVAMTWGPFPAYPVFASSAQAVPRSQSTDSIPH